MENELSLFKRDLLQGGLIWLKAESSSDAICLGEEMISRCEISSAALIKLSMKHFMQLIFLDLFDSICGKAQVILIYGFEGATAREAAGFVKAIRYFRSFYVPLGMRVVLASGEKISSSLQELHEFSPLSIVVKGRWGVDCMDSRIHRLLERASSRSKRSVKKISERAAVFLENVMAAEKDEDIYSMISAGLNRSDGEVLRFKDLVPSLRPYFRENDERDGVM